MTNVPITWPAEKDYAQERYRLSRQVELLRHRIHATHAHSDRPIEYCPECHTLRKELANA